MSAGGVIQLIFGPQDDYLSNENDDNNPIDPDDNSINDNHIDINDLDIENIIIEIDI